ncbi:MAG: RdgB/HAM1 family non-canonical purine NTP pyrophosphatase [Gammaproteobacteria bacterium]|nr:RdgB/HAM1 family non-canonical purine NTP pyrophosphatase [Gammaproteobacteria bacterium]
MLYIATHNLKKFAEIEAILAPMPCQSAVGIQTDAPLELGLSFLENAIIKARALSQITKTPVIADDSGLVVPSLNGAPGIYSARYAGIDANDEKNINLLLKQFKDQPSLDNKAYFICVMVYLTHALDPCPIIAQGRLHGEIINDIRGEFGFGYDPVFYLADKQKTLAELPANIKNKISHRYHALQSLQQQLRQNDTHNN